MWSNGSAKVNGKQLIGIFTQQFEIICFCIVFSTYLVIKLCGICIEVYVPRCQAPTNYTFCWHTIKTVCVRMRSKAASNQASRQSAPVKHIPRIKYFTTGFYWLGKNALNVKQQRQYCFFSASLFLMCITILVCNKKRVFFSQKAVDGFCTGTHSWTV